MTANLLVHSDLFRAGIARSGADNRTLTPFGFQAEQRTYWQAPEVYNAMSPFAFAPRIKAPILLIHGEADDAGGVSAGAPASRAEPAGVSHPGRRGGAHVGFPGTDGGRL